MHLCVKFHVYSWLSIVFSRPYIDQWPFYNRRLTKCDQIATGGIFDVMSQKFTEKTLLLEVKHLLKNILLNRLYLPCCISLCQNHNQATRVKPHLRYHGLMFTKKSSIQFILCTFSCHPSQLRIDNYCSCRSLFVYGIAAPKGFQLTVKFESISFLALLIVIQVA